MTFGLWIWKCLPWFLTRSRCSINGSLFAVITERPFLTTPPKTVRVYSRLVCKTYHSHPFKLSSFLFYGFEWVLLVHVKYFCRVLPNEHSIHPLLETTVAALAGFFFPAAYFYKVLLNVVFYFVVCLYFYCTFANSSWALSTLTFISSIKILNFNFLRL